MLFVNPESDTVDLIFVSLLQLKGILCELRATKSVSKKIMYA